MEDGYDTVADNEIVNPIAHRDDFTSPIAQGDPARLDREQALGNQIVFVIERACIQFHEYLTWTWLPGFRAIHEFQTIKRRGINDTHRTHKYQSPLVTLARRKHGKA